MDLVSLTDIDSVVLRFTDLGKTLAEISAQNQTSIQDTTKALQEGFQALSSDVLSSNSFQNLQGSQAILETSVASVTKLFANLLSGASNSFSALSKTSDGVKLQLDEFSKALSEEKARQAKQASHLGGTEAVKSEEDKKKDQKSKLPKVIQREIGTLKSRGRQGLGKLMIPSPGGILGGLIGIMAYGFIEEDRIKKEAGEMKNALEGAADAGIKGIWQKGTAKLSSLQESLQKYSGIAKEESQAVAQTFAQGGVLIEEMSAGVDKSLGRVGSSAVALTLGLDKMFEMSGGTTAQKAVGFMHNYGMNIKDASEMVKDMYLNEQAMKIGAPTFVHNIEAAAEAVKDFGFGIRGVMDIAGKLQESFEKIGLPKQFAGKMAGMGVQQMAQGIANLSNDWKALLGRKMGLQGSGAEVVQGFEEAYTKIKAGTSDEELMRFTIAAYETAKEATGGDEARMYLMLSQADKMGMGSYGARSILEIGKEMEKGGAVSALKATTEHAAGLRKSFKTEAEKTGEFQRNMNKWMKGMSEVGQGLLGLVGKFLAHLIITFRMWPEMFGALVTADFARLREIQAQAAGAVVGWKNDIDLLKGGFAKMGSAGKEMFGDVFSSSIGAIESAFTTPFSGELAAPEKKPIGDDRLPIVKPVYIPVAQGAGDYAVSMDPAAEAAAEDFARQSGAVWVGGGPILRKIGPDEQGNLKIMLMGNCPRCGLIFGGGEGGVDSIPAGKTTFGESLSPQSSAYFSQSNEATIVSPNTGESKRVDLGRSTALKDIRDLSLTGNMRKQISGAGKDLPDLDPKLLPLLQDISKQYAGKDIRIYKSAGAGEKAHGKGQALDIGVAGVKKADLFKYLHSKGYGKKQGGLGYYTQAPFVHVDVREKPAMWVDTSGAGEEAQNEGSPTAWLQKNIGLGKA